MTSEKIIEKFELYVDDATELSSTDELELLNKKYQEVCSERPWEFLKKAFSGFINGTSINLPTDFQYILDTEVNALQGKFVFVNERYFKVLNFSERRDYENKGGYCWLNMSNNTLEFSESVSGTLKFDYIYTPEDLDLDDEPIFPPRFHDVLAHLMASDDYMIQQFDKAKSYAGENEMKAEKILDQMRYWNSQLIV
jgi:hypothetical protein